MIPNPSDYGGVWDRSPFAFVSRWPPDTHLARLVAWKAPRPFKFRIFRPEARTSLLRVVSVKEACRPVTTRGQLSSQGHNPLTPPPSTPTPSFAAHSHSRGHHPVHLLPMAAGAPVATAHKHPKKDVGAKIRVWNLGAKHFRSVQRFTARGAAVGVLFSERYSTRNSQALYIG